MIRKVMTVLFSKLAKGYAKEISHAQKWIDSAQAQFAKAIEEAELAEKEFDQIAQAKLKQAESIMEQVGEATEKMEQAKRFKDKITKFVYED